MMRRKRFISSFFSKSIAKGFLRRCARSATASASLPLPPCIVICAFDPNKKRAYTVPDYRRDKTASLPLLGKVAAGLPILAHENREDVFPVPSMLLHGLRSDAFMLRVDGESMKNAGICDRDIIVVELGTVPKDGDIVVARVNSEEVTVKRFFQKGKEIELRPENEAFSSMVYPIDQVEILGCVTGLLRSY